VVPKRIYNPEPAEHVLTGLSKMEAVVAAAIYSRHDDGFVRQRQLGTLLGAEEPWTAPFIVQLLGEYVIEICRDIERFAQTEFRRQPAMQENLSASRTTLLFTPHEGREHPPEATPDGSYVRASIRDRCHTK
jgi:hypothetical protein